MQFLEKLFLGRKIPEYTEQASYPSTTYKKGKCTRKHCNELCESRKSEYDWEYWAFFLSERDVSKTSLLKKIYLVHDDLRFSVWSKLLGVRDLNLAMKTSFEPKKSDRNVADYILLYCSNKNTDNVIGGKQIERIMFNIYRNIIDIFYNRKEEKTCQKSTVNEILKEKDEKDEKPEKIEKGKEEDMVENDVEDIDDSSVYNNLSTSFNIYTGDIVDEDLVVFLDYFLNMEYCVEEFAFRIIYILFERMRLGDIYFLKIRRESYLCKGFSNELYEILKKTNFRFIKLFITHLIQNDVDILNKIIDNALCFSSSSLLEIFNKIILDCSDHIISLKSKVSGANEENNIDSESKKTKISNDKILNSNLDDRENVFIDENNSNSKNVSLDKNSTKKKSKNNISDNNKASESEDQKKEDLKAKENSEIIKKIVNIMYLFIKDNTEEKLNNYRKYLRQQPINILQLEPLFETQKEEYFDFLVIQNQTVKAQKNIKQELVDRIKKLHSINEILKNQNDNLKENLDRATGEIEKLHNTTIAELKNEIEKLQGRK